jgi:glucokinase
MNASADWEDFDMLTIGVDLGGTKIAAGLCDGQGNILRMRSIPTGAGRPREQILSDMAALCRGLAAEHGVPWADIAAVGIASPGFIDANAGVVIFAGNLNWHNAPVAAELSALLGTPAFVDNDANVAALGEVASGGMRGRRNAILLTLGTGVGGGVVLDGRILSGSHGGGGELGHMTLVWRGEPCTCGNRGCLEQYCSATALIREGRRAAERNPKSAIVLTAGSLEAITAKTIVDCARNGDADAIRVFDDYLDALAMGIISLINIFDPEAVAIGGGVSAAGDFLLKPLREKVAGYAVSAELVQPDIVLAELGNDAGIVGAAQLARVKIG